MGGVPEFFFLQNMQIFYIFFRLVFDIAGVDGFLFIYV